MYKFEGTVLKWNDNLKGNSVFIILYVLNNKRFEAERLVKNLQFVQNSGLKLGQYAISNYFHALILITLGVWLKSCYLCSA